MKKWAKIPFAQNYSASTDGEIRNDKTGRILKPTKHSCGYRTVYLGRLNGPYYVHRIVAITFLGDFSNEKQVDHINGDKSDNRLENLRWLTRSENRMAYGYEKPNIAKQKKVKAENTKTNETIIFDSRKECAEYFHCHSSKIKYDHVFTSGEKEGWKFLLV